MFELENTYFSIKNSCYAVWDTYEKFLKKKEWKKNVYQIFALFITRGRARKVSFA